MRKLAMLGDLERTMPSAAFAEQGWGNCMHNPLNRLALAATVALAAVGVVAVGAQAADLGVKAPLRPAAPYNWTGCYIGGFVGWAAANQWTSTDLNGFPSGVGSFSSWDFSLGNEAIGGGTVGCNWQANSWFVLGLEGEGGYLNVEGSGPQPLLPPVLPPGGFGSVSATAKMGTGYGLVAGRVGVAFDRLLLYAKLGVAFFDTSATITDAATPGFVATGSKSQTPFTVGGGGEYAIYDHWTGKFEYMFVEKGSSFNACGSGFCWKQDPSTAHIAKVGLNYKF